MFKIELLFTSLSFAICGWPGVGTTSIAKVLKEILEKNFPGYTWEIVSGGALFRLSAMQRYPDLKEEEALAKFEVDAQTDLSLDRIVDQTTANLVQKNPFVIVDARLAAMFMPKETYKVFAWADRKTAAIRAACRSNNVKIGDVTETMWREQLFLNSAREDLASARYKALYPDFTSLSAQVPAWNRSFKTTEMSVEKIATDIFIDWRQRNQALN